MPIITHIRKSGRFALVRFDDNAQHKIHQDISVEWGLAVGTTLDERRLSILVKQNESKLVFDKALDLLSRRPHGKAELRRKLKIKGFPEVLILESLDKCEKMGVLNDHDFAFSAYEELSAKGYGQRRIQAELLKKGLDSALIEQVMGSNDCEKTEKTKLEKAFNTKLRSLKNVTDNRKKKEKIIRHLMSKGFRTDLIFQFLDENRHVF